MKKLFPLLTLFLFYSSLAFSFEGYNYQAQIMEQQRLEIEALQDDEIGYQEDARWYSEQQKQDKEDYDYDYGY